MNVDIVTDYAAVPDGSTDNTDALNQALVDVYAAGGGVIRVPLPEHDTGPLWTFRCDGQLIVPDDGDPSHPRTRPISIKCDVPQLTAWPAMVTPEPDPSGGAILDLRYQGAAKIVSHGIGCLTLENLVLAQYGDAADTTPFFLGTGTTSRIKDTRFIGHPANVGMTCVQDAVQFGGTEDIEDDTDLSKFQGYGTILEGCQFTRIRRAVWCKVAANGVVIRANRIAADCGGITAIHVSGSVTKLAYAVKTADNIIEMRGYQYGITWTNAAECASDSDKFFDAVKNNPTLAYYRNSGQVGGIASNAYFSDDTIPALFLLNGSRMKVGANGALPS